MIVYYLSSMLIHLENAFPSQYIIAINNLLTKYNFMQMPWLSGSNYYHTNIFFSRNLFVLCDTFWALIGNTNVEHYSYRFCFFKSTTLTQI